MFMESSPQSASPELAHVAKELMHQGALLTLDVATGRTKADLDARAQMLQSLVQRLMGEIEVLPHGPSAPDPGYWDAFFETRKDVCFKCAFRRDPDPQAELALNRAQQRAA